MPLALELSHRLLIELAELRRENKDITYLRPDAKSQVTIEYSDDNVPQRIDAIVVSTQHDDFDTSDEAVMLVKRLKLILLNILIPRVVAKLPTNIQKLYLLMKLRIISIQLEYLLSEDHMEILG